MQIEEHRTGFDQTLTLEQSTAEQIGEEACPTAVGHRGGQGCSAPPLKKKTPAEPELARESTAAGFARARKRTDEEPLDGDAPTLRPALLGQLLPGKEKAFLREMEAHLSSPPSPLPS